MSDRNPDPLALQGQAIEQLSEAAETMGSLPDANQEMADVEVGQTPSEVVYEENKLELLHYESQTDEQYDVPILMVYALINRPYILDLQPDRSVVRTFLEEGFDVYLIDWNEPSLLDASLGFQDYVDRYIDNCVDVVRERSGVDAINLFGYCMGATMSVAYSALYPEKVRNLGLMAAALCFTEEGGIFGQWIEEGDLDFAKMRDVFGTVPAELLDLSFELSEPVENLVSKYFRFFDNVEDEEFVRNFARMERWIDESIDVAGQMVVEFVEATYQEGTLYDNEFYVGDKHADIQNLEMPIAQVVANYDHIVPPAASTTFNEAVPSDDITVFDADTGHIGLSVSSRSHAELWPDVCDWYAERSQLDADGEPVDADGEPVDVAGDATTEAASANTATETEETETAADATSDTEPSGENDGTDASDASEDTGPALTDINGIGPAYAERLREAGVTSVDALADAEVVALADAADVPVGRLEGWITQARDMV
ncbi:alpha/beta fold hydrolase [Halosegnis sp.]|uniref:alpha/beta fold hydrolase n=1 Tax=Halosegnis sp. TaxID=2864959 RepID=UPI0035D525A3